MLCNEMNEMNENDILNKNRFFDSIIHNEEFKFNLKIIDLGNCELISETITEEIMIRNYRPPENILDKYYNEKSDIWSIGCLIYELLTGDYLFEIDNSLNNINRNRCHLSLMNKMLGKIPQYLSIYSEYSETYFNSRGKLKKNRREYVGIQYVLIEEYNYESIESGKIEKFLKKLLDYNYKTRLSAFEAMKDEWFINTF